MRYSILAVAMLAAVTAIASVTYNTTGVFNCTNNGLLLEGCGTAQITFNNLNDTPADIALTFDPQVTNTVTPTTGAPFGDLILSCGNGTTGTSALCGPETFPAGVTLTITIVQTACVPSCTLGSQALSLNASFISGTTMTGQSSGGSEFIYSSASTASIGGYLYSIGPVAQPLIPPASGGPNFGDVTLQGLILNQTVPEPATFSLIGGALLGLGIFRKKLTRR